MQEIERKFLVSSHVFKKQATARNHIVQGFLNTDPARTVRVRIQDENAYLTIKGKSSNSGLSRFEWETPIPVTEARALLNLSEQPPMEKYRYCVPSGGHVFEVDEFLGENQGLLIAEVELSSEGEEILLPAWLGAEVTGQEQYYNSQLSKRPYKSWQHPLK